MKFLRRLFAATAILMAAASACQVPVFRYALERWPADRYELAVFFRDTLTQEQERALEAIDPTANIELVKVDTAKMEIAENAIYGAIDLPSGGALLRLYYPRDSGIDKPVWESELSEDAVRAITDSPARREIRKRILSGKSAVWLVVGGDDALEEKLRTQLATVSESLEIPEGVIGPGSLERVASGEIAMEDVLRSPIPLKIDFDVLQIDRDDPAEEVFVSMLFGVSTEALEQFPDAPLVFPVFGRGRMIDGVPASALSEGLLSGACGYLCGACSCEVKKENPGIDLVMSADWDEETAGSEVVVDKALPPLSGAGDLVETEPAPEKAPQPSNPLGFLALSGILALSSILVVAIATLVLRKGSNG